MTTVTIDIDKVKAAAATSPEAKKALRVLCPEAFVSERVRGVEPLSSDWKSEVLIQFEAVCIY